MYCLKLFQDPTPISCESALINTQNYPVFRHHKNKYPQTSNNLYIVFEKKLYFTSMTIFVYVWDWLRPANNFPSHDTVDELISYTPASGLLSEEFRETFNNLSN
jgi:hypothetical protein